MCSPTQLDKMPGRLRSGIFVLRFLFRLGGILLLWAGVQLGAMADCRPPENLEKLRVAKVVDGDTLHSRDQRKIRLLHINTPELGREGRPDQRFAREAKAAVEDWLSAGGEVLVAFHGKDRYGRHLAEVYSPGGELLTEHLLRAGLGWRILVPSTAHHRGNMDRPCLYQAEQQARRHKRGLWSRPILNTGMASRADQGFTLLRGRVEHVARTRHSTWIEMQGDVVLHIAASDLHWFDPLAVSQWPGKQVEVRGWLRYRRPPRPGLATLRMDLRHPAMIRVSDQ